MFIDDCGKVCITVKPPSNYRKERGRATGSAQIMRPRPNNEDNLNCGGVTISLRGYVAPNVGGETLPAQDQQATCGTVGEVEDESFHSPREVEEEQPNDPASSSTDVPPPPPVPEASSEELKAREELRKQRRRDLRNLAQSKYHLLDHYEYNPDCLGCQAKVRNKKQYKGAFD